MPALADYTKPASWGAWSGMGTSASSSTKAKSGELPDFFGRTPEAAASGVMSPINFARIPGFDPILAGAAEEATALRPSSSPDLARYRAAIGATAPDIRRYTTQEVGDIGNVYSPTGYETQMANIRSRRAAALADMQRRLFGDLRQQMGLDVVGSPASGLNSYMMEKAGDQAARIREQAIADAADQERKDLADLMAARAGQQGRRMLLTDAELARMMAPTESAFKYGGAYQDIISRALQSALANTDIGYATPV